ncbi:MAG: conjugative transfer system coupling protein TraD [Spongiibacteraceae bacterium]|jgi:conjugal transfer pilus assembly protein TraD|nr:conjugative transfer system coupling protein TraD [Spongiibacteraceae bacterium]
MSEPIKYEIPFRPIYEGWSALGWGLGAASSVAFATAGNMPAFPMAVMAGSGAAMGLYRGAVAVKRYRDKRRLYRTDPWLLKLSKLKKQMPRLTKGQTVWFGDGFEWTAEQTQLMHEVLRAKLDVPIEEKARKKGEKDPRNKRFGAYWLHGLGKPAPIAVPAELFTGHLLCAGTTGCGKTRLLTWLCSQAIMRPNEAIIIIDPKGDQDLRMAAQQACEMMGQAERFVYFHPAFPDQSARIDPLRNWNRPTEIASRIAALIPSETGADPFTAFAWKALNDIVNGQIATGERPNLVKIKRYIEGGVEPLVNRALRYHFDKHSPNWEGAAAKYLKKHKNNETDAYIEFYRAEIQQHAHSSELDGLISGYTHNRDHFQKMIASLIPVLSMLTAGDLGALLSPEPNPDDERPILDMAQIISKGMVAYIGLDSLSDSTIGSAIGSILLADLTAVAGDRYNYRVAENIPVNVYVDEAAEVINKPTIQLMNKGRGAGFRLAIFTQTYSDFVARMGNKANADQVLGNTNIQISMRVLDTATQDYITKGLPEVPISRLDVSFRHGADTESPTTFSGGTTEGVKSNDMPLFPGPMLARLPNFHFVARLAGGRFVKAMIPITTV